MTRLRGRSVGLSDSIVENNLRITDDEENPVNLSQYNIGAIRFKGYIFMKNVKISALHHI